jgi:hypothetical protein
MENNKSISNFNNLISKEFINGDYKNFINEYDIHLIDFIEWKRLRGRFEKFNYDVDKIEKDFIAILGNYLHHKNQELLRKNEEEIREIQKNFLLKYNVSEEVLIDAIENSDKKKNYERSGEMYDLLFEYTTFKIDRRDSKTIEQKCNKTFITSYNYKIHYLKYRAEQIGSKVSFEKGFEFNDLETNEIMDVEFQSKFNRSQKFIMLKELGFIDFLKEKYHYLSENKLGEILMDITGDRNYQDKLNGHKNQTANDPYINHKAVETIRKHLMLNRNITKQ